MQTSVWKVIVTNLAWTSIFSVVGMTSLKGEIQAIYNDTEATVKLVDPDKNTLLLTTVPANPNKSPVEKQITVEDERSATILNNVADQPNIVKPVISSAGSVESVETKSTQKWSTLDTKIAPGELSKLKEVDKAIADLKGDLAEYLQTQDKDAKSSLITAYEDTRQRIVNAYHNTSNPQTKTHLASQYSSFASEEKAWHGRDDNYSPDIYLDIYKTAASCVAVVDRSTQTPLTSGALIGQNLILTCAHKVAEKEPEEIEIWFDHKYGNAGSPNIEKCNVVKLVAKGDPLDTTTTPLDYSLWEITRSKPEISRPIMPLNTGPVGRGTSIYLIGHPSATSQIVHDNSWVLFPFEASETEYAALETAIHGEFISATNGSSLNLANLFMSSYKPFTTPSGNRRYRYIGSWSDKVLPFIGIESDTFKGDSGSPAIIRKTDSTVIGILIEGQRDQGNFGTNASRMVDGYKSGWAYHERLLPTKVIVEQLNTKVPQWKTMYGPIIR